MFPLRRPSDPVGTTVDVQNERAGCLAVLAVSVLFILSTFYSWHEFRYALWGETIEARVTRAFETVELTGRGRRIEKLAVLYSFVDPSNNEVRSERDNVNRDWPAPGETALVQYIPGEPGRSRLSGHRHMLSVVFFFACVVALAAFVYRMHREVSRSPARRVPGRRL